MSDLVEENTAAVTKHKNMVFNHWKIFIANLYINLYGVPQIQVT